MNLFLTLISHRHINRSGFDELGSGLRFGVKEWTGGIRSIWLRASIPKSLGGQCGVLFLATALALSSAFGNTAERVAAFGRFPLHFEANQGQADQSFDFVSRGRGHGIFLNATQAVLVVRSAVAGAAATSRPSTFDPRRPNASEARIVRMNLIGANPYARGSGVEEMAAKINYLIGNDPARWRRGLAAFGRVHYEEVYPGMDLVYYGNEERLEYDFIVAPGASYRGIALRFEGADRLWLDAASGELVLAVGREELRLHAPLVYQTTFGLRQEISGAYRLLDNDSVAFDIGDYDPAKTLVIDPVIDYSTYLGGNQDETGWDIDVDPAGNAYITGETMSALGTIWMTPGVFQPTNAGGPIFRGKIVGGDVFVAKLDPMGSLVYFTYLGGSGRDAAFAIQTDVTGNAYVAGVTDSTNFPVSNGSAIQGTPDRYFQNYPPEIFVAKLDSSGASLTYGTYLGGAASDFANGLAVDATGNAYICGATSSTNFLTNATSFFATTNYPALTNFSSRDAFVIRLDALGNTNGSVRFGSSALNDQARGIAVDPQGRVYVVGATEASVNNGGPATARGLINAFVASFDFTNQTTLYFSTFGGSGTNIAYNLRVDSQGFVYVVGTKTGPDFPTTPGRQNPGGVFKSIDGGNTWAAANTGLTHPHVRAVAIDPSSPANLFAGTPRGVFLSADAAGSWIPAVSNVGLATVRAVAVDPTAPSVLYAGSSAGVSKSTDGGVNWSNTSTGLTALDIYAVIVAPLAASNVYAGARGGVFKSTNGALSWARINSGLGNTTVNALAIDPLANATLYAGTAGGVYKSTNAGANWRAMNNGLANRNVAALVIDPLQPQNLYAGTVAGLFKSTDGGTNWVARNGGRITNVTAIAIDPITPATLFAAGTNGVFRSTNGAINWDPKTIQLFTNDLSGRVVSLVIDPAIPSTVYAGLGGTNGYGGTNDAFLAKLSPDGSNFVYSVVFGGNGSDEAFDLAVTTNGQAFITGTTTSTNFPVDVEPAAPAAQKVNSGKHDAFVAGFDTNAARLLYSTMYFGGRGQDYGYGIDLDGAINLYVIGRTAVDGSRISTGLATNGLQLTFGGGTGDAFLAKIDRPLGASSSISLSIASTGGQLKLSWPAPAPSFQLQSTDSLGNSWMPVSDAVSFETNGLNCVIVPASSPSRFFRLVDPSRTQ